MCLMCRHTPLGGAQGDTGHWHDKQLTSPALQVRSMKRARDVRDQLVGLMERVEIDMVSHADDHEGVKKARGNTALLRLCDKETCSDMQCVVAAPKLHGLS